MTDGADDRLGELAQRWQDDKSPRVALQLAEEYRRQERYDEAADVLEASVAEHPNSVSGRVALGRVLLDGERDQRAAEVLGEVIDNDPTQLVATKLLVEAFIRLGRSDDARERLRYYGLLNDSDPDIPELRRRIGHLTADDPSRLDDTRAPGADAADAPDVEDSIEDDPFALDAPAPARGEMAATAAMAEPVAEKDDEDDNPFPDLIAEAEAEPVTAAALEVDDPFDFLAPARAPAPAVEPPATPGIPDEDDPFELSPPSAAPTLDEDPLADVLDQTVGAVPTPAPDLDSAPEPGTAPEDTVETPEPALAVETAPAVEPEAPEPEPDTPAATATLGQLYLRQGHLDDAEEIFRQVLDGDPGHEAARAGLDEVARRRREAAETAEPEPSAGTDRRPLTAEDLLAGDRPDGLTAKKRLILERYLERIRRSADADVH